MMKLFLLLALVLPHPALAVCSATDAYSTAVCADSPAAYWRLSETGALNGIAAADAGGNSRPGHYIDAGSSLSGSITGAVGGSNTAVEFNSSGVDGKAQLCGIGSTPSCAAPTSNYLSPGASTTWTIEFWGKFSTTPCNNSGVPMVIINQGDFNDGGTNREQYRVLAGCSGATNYYQLVICQNSGFCTDFLNAHTFFAGDVPAGFNHIVFTTNVATPVNTPYLNAVATTADTTGDGTVAGNGGDIAQLGQLNNGAGDVWPYKGTLDEIAIYTSVLSAGIITAHYNAAFAAGSMGRRIFQSKRDAKTRSRELPPLLARALTPMINTTPLFGTKIEAAFVGSQYDASVD
jgi:hypothetical protein